MKLASRLSPIRLQLSGLRWTNRDSLAVLVMAIVVTICACASFRLSKDAGDVTSIWVSNGVISGFILTAPRRRRIPFFVTGQLVNIVLGLALGDALLSECWFSLCNSVEVLITVLPLKHFAARADILNKRAMCRLVYFGLFLGPLIGGIFAAPALVVFEGQPLLQSLRVWFLSDALGSAVSLPLVLFLMTRGRKGNRTISQKVADIAGIAFLTAASVAVFAQTLFPVAFLLFPPLLALIFRLRMRGAIIGTSIVVAMGAAFTAEGHGPFALNSANTINTHVMLFQLFGLIVFASCFPLGLVLDQRNALQDELKLANQKLSDLAHRDGLTGLLNRRSFDEILESAWAHADSSGGILSLLYIDIDFFKRFNDTYGHQSGDDCLRSVARALVESVRLSTDCVARYGGEEFVIVLPEASENATRATAERIAIAIRDLEIRHDGSPVGAVTASFGVATARPCQGGSPSWLVHLADDALYAAKRAGRNRIETSHRTESVERVVA